MFYRFFSPSLVLVLIISCSTHSFAIDVENNDNPQALIDYAISQQKSSPDVANNTLYKAFSLARQQNNKALMAKAVMEQAQTAKIHKNYEVTKQYLIKAESISASLNDNALKVNILINMSTALRYLKEYEESRDYIEKALLIAHESLEPNLIFKCLQIKGRLLQSTKAFRESLEAFLLAQRYTSNTTSLDKVKLFRNIANGYIKVDEYQSGIKNYNKALTILKNINDKKAMPATLVDISTTHQRIGEYSQAIESGTRGLTIAREYNIEKQILRALVNLSIIYRKISSYENALTHGLEALEIYQKNNNYNGIAASANTLGLVYLYLNQDDNAKAYFEQVLSLPIDNVKVKYRAAASRDLAKLIFKDDKQQKALELSKEADMLYAQIGDSRGQASVQTSLGSLYSMMGDLNYSINAYNNSITLFNKLGDTWSEASSIALLAKVLVEIDTKKSIELAQSSLALATEIGAKSVAESSYTALILAEAKRGDFEQALSYAKSKEILTNEIKTDAINKRSAEMFIILNVEKKERAIEKLKREKSVISLELDNQDTKSRLREQAKVINTLEKKITFIITCVIVMGVTLALLVISRVYFNLQYLFIISIIVMVILLFYSVNSHAKDIIKTTSGQSKLDIRTKYALRILDTALKFSIDKYGAYETIIVNENLSNEVRRWEVYDGNNINLTMAMTSPDWEYLTIPIRIPIRRGIGSYRLLAINKSNQETFTKRTTVEQLKVLTAGVQKGWTLNELLEDSKFNTVESSTYDGVFRMLNSNRFDFIPRGINEIYDELSIRKDELPNLMVEPNLAIYLPQPYYIFVSPKFPRIAERIEYGLEKMIAEGVLQKIFNENFSAFIKQAKLSNRTVLNIGNRYLTKKTPLERKELWLRFDLNNE